MVVRAFSTLRSLSGQNTLAPLSTPSSVVHSAYKPIASTVNRAEVDWVGRISFELLPELHNVIVYRARR
jgi:hypothetical protein